ncbi:hypothetical protein [Pseudochrobactrum sp. MP213Fo]|uniref:hypothetical protein n=1 Tax=Pseudochrobactrum sp. MP213Fo TaxID=3022250 RepID=UPI003BA1D52B
MMLKTALIEISKRYACAKCLSVSRVSTLVFGDGKVIARLEAGAGITTDRFELGIRWFSTNWPEQAVWPADVYRPYPDEVVQ